MPKRSNDFQHLVKVIYDAISKVEEARVTESAMLTEPDGTLREVDILLERTVADVPIRLAVECRDRSRKSDVDWIDGLIGKFRNLQVDKIVAVCRRGFSPAAIAKAAANKIELRVLSECLTHEWSSEFMRLGFATLEFAPELRTVEIALEPSEAEGIGPSCLVEDLAVSAAQRSLEQFVFACFVECVAPHIKRYIEQEFLTKLPPLADLTRLWEFTVPIEIQDAWVVSNIGVRHRIAHMLFGVVAQSRADIAPIKHYQYGTTALASEGELNFGTRVHKMRVVQVTGQKSLTASIIKIK
jgi:hypothetical protein